MDLSLEKRWLIEKILRMQDIRLIQALTEFVQSSHEDDQSGVSIHELRAKVEAAQKDYQEGRITPHLEFKEKVKTWKNR